MRQKATFALGCFWEPQDYFSKLPGVITITVGYIGGKSKNPTYAKVCGGNTGHSEAIEIIFDDELISFKQLLNHFWKWHNPTEKNINQYASAIFYHNENQKKQANDSKKCIENKLGSKVVTKIIKATIFYQAEEYHQRFLEKMTRFK